MIIGIVVLVGLLLYVTPRVARPGLFFGVTVDPGFTANEAARRINRRYGIEIVAHSAVALALMFAFGLVPAVLWQVIGGGWAFANANRAALPHTAGESPIREAGLDPQPEESLFATVLALAPLALLFLLALYAHSHWDQIPDRFPVHFGFQGPDQWVTRTPRSVYGLIILNGSLCGLMLAIRYGVRHGSRRVAIDGASAQAEAHFRRIITWLLVTVEYLMVIFAWVFLFSSPQVATTLGIGMLVLTVFLVFALLRMGQQGEPRRARRSHPTTAPRMHAEVGHVLHQSERPCAVRREAVWDRLHGESWQPLVVDFSGDHAAAADPGQLLPALRRAFARSGSSSGSTVRKSTNSRWSSILATTGGSPPRSRRSKRHHVFAFNRDQIRGQGFVPAWSRRRSPSCPRSLGDRQSIE